MPMEDKLAAARLFKHLKLIKCISENGEVFGFKMNVRDFCETVRKGCVQQKRKKSVYTQTTEEDFNKLARAVSPSIFSKEFKNK